MSVAVSIVSHGHGSEVLALLRRIQHTSAEHVARVWLTLNTPEPGLRASLSRTAWPFDLRLIANAQPMGFGANHNQAFQQERSAGRAPYFAVLNPDVDWREDPFAPLLAAAGHGTPGLVYPRQISPGEGCLLDHERALPTPWALLRRHLKCYSGLPAAPGRIDWVNAAFLLFPAAVYQAIGGFDARYHMYCEDVDLCLRLRLAGYPLCRADGAIVFHGAHRRSRRGLRHFAWHLASLLRLWSSRPYREYRRQQKLGL